MCHGGFCTSRSSGDQNNSCHNLRQANSPQSITRADPRCNTTAFGIAIASFLFISLYEKEVIFPNGDMADVMEHKTIVERSKLENAEKTGYKIFGPGYVLHLICQLSIFILEQVANTLPTFFCEHL